MNVQLFDKKNCVAIMIVRGIKYLANLFSKKIKGEEKRSQLQPVSFADDDKSIAALKKSQLDSYDELESYKKLRKRRLKKATVRIFIWLAVIIFIPVFVFFSVVIINPKAGHNFFGYSVYMVTSTSMVGVFDKGDCIIIKTVSSEKEVKRGTDITFIRRSDGETVTHRVIDIIENTDGELEYITKGVNNPAADSGSVAFEDVLGIRVCTSVGLGNMIEFFRTPYGIITFLVSFVLIIVVLNIGFKFSDDIRAVGMK